MYPHVSVLHIDEWILSAFLLYSSNCYIISEVTVDKT